MLHPVRPPSSLIDVDVVKTKVVKSLVANEFVPVKPVIMYLSEAMSASEMLADVTKYLILS